jgi:hypothetical protein
MYAMRSGGEGPLTTCSRGAVLPTAPRFLLAAYSHSIVLGGLELMS